MASRRSSELYIAIAQVQRYNILVYFVRVNYQALKKLSRFTIPCIIIGNKKPFFSWKLHSQWVRHAW